MHQGIRETRIDVISNLKKLKIEQVAVSELKPNTYNPNRYDKRLFELLCKSIQSDGFTQPIVALRESKIIVDGEHRWRAAKTLELNEIPVVFVEMSEVEAKIATLRHNRTRGKEDVDLSAEVLKSLRDVGYLVSAQNELLLKDKEIQKLLAGVEDEIEVDVPEEVFVPKDIQEKRPAVMPQMPVFTPMSELKPDINLGGKQQDYLDELNRKTYRIAVAFTGDDAVLVRNILGQQPATKLVQLCKKYEGKFAHE